MSPFDVLEEAVNEVSDRDGSWWPFLWMRPEKHARLALRRLVSLALLNGLPAGGLLALSLSMVDPDARGSAPFFVAVFPLLLLFVGSVVVAPMWNRRAARLRSRIR